MRTAILSMALALAGLASTRATPVVFVGSEQYQTSGSSVTLSCNEILNQSASTTSGTLRIELWAFTAPFAGGSQNGYVLATYQLNPLKPGYYYTAFSETVPYTAPPNGTWYYSLLLTEYTGASSDSGYSTDNYANFPNPVQIGPVVAAPSITSQPSSVTVTAGASVSFSVAATGTAPLSYQWYFNGSGIAGAAAATYTLSSAQSANAGTYTCVVSNSAGSVTSSGAVLTVTAIATARLTNLSIRSVGGGAQTLIAGFVIGGTGSKQVLVRADGPALASFGVSGVLPDPLLVLDNSSAVQIGSNAGWGNSASLSAVFSQVGAFALSPGSKDAALLTPLSTGAYTATAASQTNDSGVVLVEVYDADSGTPAARFINLSARSLAGTGSQTLIAGFVILGTGTEKVLIRADGPALSSFGVGGVLAQPVLSLFDSSGNLIATNTGWANAPTRGSSSVSATVSAATSAVFSQVGAFALAANSADSALVATLPPGAYSAQIAGLNATTGQALAEVYEVSGSSSSGTAPVITSQPVSQTITSGGTVTLTVTVSGSATYQWYLNGSPIPGATGSSYTASASGSYTVVVTNAAGSTTSAAAVLTAGSTGTGTGITGTWSGTWTEQNAGGGFCQFETWNETWTLTQSGNQVTGTYTATITSEDNQGLCPDSVGARESGQLSGTVTGSTFTLVTVNGTYFSGQISGSSLSGLGSNAGPNGEAGSISTGTFSLNRQ